MRKYIPYLYFAFVVLIVFDTFSQFFNDKEVYRIIFNWTTESKYLFAGVKTLFAAFILYGGLRRLKANR